MDAARVIAAPVHDLPSAIPRRRDQNDLWRGPRGLPLKTFIILGSFCQSTPVDPWPDGTMGGPGRRRTTILSPSPMW